MISVDEALAHVLAQVPASGTTTLPLAAASGHVLAADVLAPIAHPIFDQSAVDGYAIRFADLARFGALTQVGEIQAGAPADQPLAPGQCLRIFTGAPVPDSADTVVMQEYATVRDARIVLNDPRLQPGGNIRRQGEQIRAGARALPAGHRLDAAGIGFLASLGIREVRVHERPRVALLITGNEFAQSEADLKGGLIFESNGQMLQDALAGEGIPASFATVRDERPAMQAAIRRAAAAHDILIVTGGVSVGDYDYTRESLEADGFEAVFHKVNQKPGKPLLFMRKGEQVAFGLPGNPRAVLMCFHIYVLPYLRARQAGKLQGRRAASLPLCHAHRKKADGKTHFVTGRLEGAGISLLQLQQSHMLQSFALADVIVALPGDQDEYVAGDLVEAKFLPG